LVRGAFAWKARLFGPSAGRPATGPSPWAIGSIKPLETREAKEIALSASDPNYDPATDVYRQIYRGHDNASAVTNNEGLTVYFDPDTNEVLGFAITKFSDYYKAHATEDGDFEVSIPKWVPANLEEEMDLDADSIKSGVRIAEFY
jgi:hypothetical protein